MPPVVMPDVGLQVPWSFVVMQVVIALIGSMSGIIAAVAAARAKRVEKVAEALTEKQAQLVDQQEVIHKLVNSQSEKLNKITETASFAEGQLKGAADELARAAAKVTAGQEAVLADRAAQAAQKPPPQPPLPQR